MRANKCRCHLLTSFTCFAPFHGIGGKNRQVFLKVGGNNLIPIFLYGGILRCQNKKAANNTNRNDYSIPPHRNLFNMKEYSGKMKSPAGIAKTPQDEL